MRLAPLYLHHGTALPACLPARALPVPTACSPFCVCPLGSTWPLLAPPSACAHWALHGHCLLPPLPVPTGLYTGLYMATAPPSACLCPLGSTWPLLPPVQTSGCLCAAGSLCGPLYMAACIYTMRHALRSEWPFIIIIIIWLHTCACVWLQAPCLIVLCSSWSLICLPSS